MKYKSKGYRFDSEVTHWLNELKVKYGSYNKGLRVVAKLNHEQHNGRKVKEKR